jgi:hypothetical protein
MHEIPAEILKVLRKPFRKLGVQKPFQYATLLTRLSLTAYSRQAEMSSS